LFILASYYVEQDKIFDFLVKINEMALNLLPNLLGFNLGAYTLFITFGGSEFLKKIVGFKEGNYSFYQKNSAIFAITLIIQLFSLIYSYIVSIFLELKIPGILPQLEPIVNYAVLLFTILFSLSSITIIKAIIVNLFNISQMYHIVIFKDNFTSNDSKSEN
jgi:hypothetical protein